VFGPVTEVWVEEFQIRVGLPATGVVNNATGQALARHGIRGLGW
jgi:peptidoglycan hydrolase-like protein with peptidoglycan-binding domain